MGTAYPDSGARPNRGWFWAGLGVLEWQLAGVSCKGAGRGKPLCSVGLVSYRIRAPARIAVDLGLVWGFWSGSWPEPGVELQVAAGRGWVLGW